MAKKYSIGSRATKYSKGSSAKPDSKQVAHLHPSIGMATKWAKNTVKPMARGARICKAHEKLAQLLRSDFAFTDSASGFQASPVGVIVNEASPISWLQQSTNALTGRWAVLTARWASVAAKTMKTRKQVNKVSAPHPWRAMTSLAVLR